MSLLSYIKSKIKQRNLQKALKVGSSLASKGVTQSTPRDTSGNYIVSSGGKTTVISSSGNVIKTTSSSSSSSSSKTSSSTLPTYTNSIIEKAKSNNIKLGTSEAKLSPLEVQKRLYKLSGTQDNILQKRTKEIIRNLEDSKKTSYDIEEIKRSLLLKDKNKKSGYDVLTEALLSNDKFLKKSTESLARGVSKDFYKDNKLKKAIDLLTEGELTASKYNYLQQQINTNIDYFNRKYGNKELSEEEYKKAEQLLANINYSQKILDDKSKEATGSLKELITKLSKSKSRLKILPLLSIGIVSGAVDFGYGASQIPKAVVKILRNPRNLKNITPSSIYKGFKDSVIKEITFYKINKAFGVARILTKSGLFFVTAKINQKGINLIKKINPKYKTQLFSSLEKIPKKNIVNVEINTLVKRVGKDVSLAKISIDGKGVKGLAGGFVVSVGKNKVYTLAVGTISKEGKFLMGIPKPFVTIGKSVSKKVIKQIAEKQGLEIARVYSAIGTKGYSLTEIPFRSRNLLERNVFRREILINEYLSKSLYNRLNKNLGYVSGVSQSKSGFGIRFSGYIRDITDDIERSLMKGKKVINSSKVRLIKKEIIENPNLSLTQKVNLVKTVDKAVNNAIEKSLKESSSLANSVAGVVAKQSKKVISGIKSNVLRKTAYASLQKIIINSTRTIIKNSTKNKSLSKTQIVSLIKTQLKEENLSKIIQAQIISVSPKTIQKAILKTSVIKNINPIIPTGIIPESPIIILTKELNNIPKTINDKKGYYYGYDVNGISRSSRRKLTKYPLSFNKALSVASYFAINSKKGYSVLKFSPRKLNKNVVNRPLPDKISKDYYEKNKNKIKVLRYKNKIVVKKK